MTDSTTPEQLVDLLETVAEQTRLSANIARVADSLDEQARVLSVLRSSVGAMLEDRHRSLIPAIDAQTQEIARMREEVKEARGRSSAECRTRRDKLDAMFQEMRARGYRQDAAAHRVTAENRVVEEKASEGLTFHWTQKIPAQTIGKVLAWIATALLAGTGYGELLKRIGPQLKPPAISAPALPPHKDTP